MGPPPHAAAHEAARMLPGVIVPRANPRWVMARGGKMGGKKETEEKEEEEEMQHPC